MSDAASERLQELEDLLLEELGYEAIPLGELDGLLTGLAISPDAISPGEWLPVVWGHEGPPWDERQKQAILDLIMEHYNDIVQELDRGKCSPLYDVDSYDDSLCWEIWIKGFWRAVLLRPEGWREFGAIDDDDLQTALFCLSRLYELATKEPPELEPLEVDERLEEHAPGMISDAVEMLQRARLTHASLLAGPITRNLPKVGRNDSCPCGSGRKFKNCCLN